MYKTILRFGILTLLFGVAYFVIPQEVEAQSDCIPTGCWKTITSRNGFPAMYCGTCTYIPNSEGVGTATGLCYVCPEIG